MGAFPDTSHEKHYFCPCGSRLFTQEDCAAYKCDDVVEEEAIHDVGVMYLDDQSGYCAEEDDVVPFVWAEYR